MMPYLLQKTLSQPPARPAGTRTESFAISSPIENAAQQVPEMVASAGVGSSPIQSNHRQPPLLDAAPVPTSPWKGAELPTPACGLQLQ